MMVCLALPVACMVSQISLDMCMGGGLLIKSMCGQKCIVAGAYSGMRLLHGYCSDVGYEQRYSR